MTILLPCAITQSAGSETTCSGLLGLEARLKKTSPLLETLEIDGRIAVVFSPYDISCALENQTSLQCRGYAHDDAARIAINVLLYGLWH